MPKLIVEEQKEFILLPENSILHLKVDEMDTRTVNGRNGDWEKLEIKFKILGIQAIGDGSPIENFEEIIAGPIWGSVPLRLTDSPENKLRLWAEAILGIELGRGFELDTDLFANREVRGVTSQYEKRPNAQGVRLKSHQVDSLLPKANNPMVGQGYGQQQQFPPANDPWTSVQQSAPANDPWAPQAAQPQYVQPQSTQPTYDEGPPF